MGGEDKEQHAAEAVGKKVWVLSRYGRRRRAWLWHRPCGEPVAPFGVRRAPTSAADRTPRVCRHVSRHVCVEWERTACECCAGV